MEFFDNKLLLAVARESTNRQLIRQYEAEIEFKAEIEQHIKDGHTHYLGDSSFLHKIHNDRYISYTSAELVKRGYTLKGNVVLRKKALVLSETFA